jgi:hypothetical protein
MSISKTIRDYWRRARDEWVIRTRPIKPLTASDFTRLKRESEVTVGYTTSLDEVLEANGVLKTLEIFRMRADGEVGMGGPMPVEHFVTPLRSLHEIQALLKDYRKDQSVRHAQMEPAGELAMNTGLNF